MISFLQIEANETCSAQANTDAQLNDDTNPTEGPTASKKAATDRTVLADKKKAVAKDKKRTLKRL